MQSTERRSYIGTYPSHVARDQRNAAPGGGNTFDGGGSSTLAVVGGRSDGGASAARHLLHLRYFLSPDTVRLFLYRTLEKVIESAGLTVVSVCFFSLLHLLVRCRGSCSAALTIWKRRCNCLDSKRHINAHVNFTDAVEKKFSGCKACKTMINGRGQKLSLALMRKKVLKKIWSAD